MSELHKPNEAPSDNEGLFDSRVPPFDRELNVRAILIAGAIGTVITILSFVTMWWLFLGLKGWEESKDPAPSPFQEQVKDYKPPAPNLQEFPPTTDIEAFHAWEEEILGSYSVVDEETGVARIPIERAMELVLERGFPTRPGVELDAVDDEVTVPGQLLVEPVTGDTDASSEASTLDTGEGAAAPEVESSNGHGAA